MLISDCSTHVAGNCVSMSLPRFYRGNLMTAKPWECSGSFKHWFVDQIDAVLASGPPIIRVSGRNRTLNEEDFGFTSKTLDNWREEKPKDEYPDGRKLMGIVISRGFEHLKPEHQNAVLNQWISVELNGQSHDLTDELVGMLLNMIEKSPMDFLMQYVPRHFLLFYLGVND